jgi:hypothetical protein
VLEPVVLLLEAPLLLLPLEVPLLPVEPPVLLPVVVVLFATSANCCVLRWLMSSLTLTAKLKVPACVGVPEIVPLLFSDNPGGKDPELKDQLYGCVPPVAVSVAVYDVPTWELESDEVEIFSGAATVSVVDACILRLGDCAVISTVPASRGAVNNPASEIEPLLADHFTLVIAVFVSVALNCSVPPGATVAPAGVTLMEIALAPPVKYKPCCCSNTMTRLGTSDAFIFSSADEVTGRIRSKNSGNNRNAGRDLLA